MAELGRAGRSPALHIAMRVGIVSRACMRMYVCACTWISVVYNSSLMRGHQRWRRQGGAERSGGGAVRCGG